MSKPIRLADEIEAIADAIFNQNALRSRQLSRIAARVAQLEIEIAKKPSAVSIHSLDKALDFVAPEPVWPKKMMSWYCGCGHTNGINLAVCAACGRNPNGKRL